MKRIAIALLLLSLCLLCFGCGKEKDDPATTIRYEGSTAYYVQEDASYTMELQFAKPVSVGSKICLLTEEKEILSFTTEAALSTLSIRSHKLEQNVAYNLTVNGVPQRHGVQKTEVSPTEPGYIPDPTLTTIPQEPMGQTEETTEAALSTQPTETTVGGAFSFSSPPANFNEDLTVEEIPTITVSDDPEDLSTPGGTLPSESLLDGKGESSDSSSSDTSDGSYDASGRLGSTAFVLTGEKTVFTSVRDDS